MKKLIILVAIMGLTAMGCANTGRYNTQKGAAIGAGLGALAGQAIGKNTEATLIGTGVGTLLGSIVGNGIDQQEDEYRSRSAANESVDSDYYGRYNDNYNRYGDGEPTVSRRQPPPGRWVMVQGHWQGRRWIPPHEVWMPVDPR
jgi:uncharacterized protein YcfJ